ncbi:hypothetical protein PGRAT_21460 [Paenibacillus graminis]|uniref:Uncharacterized protein n=1 Tax=Paenibacillus graminis TaxID=189425 RepID=A0A089MEQ6_9BACL|nr:hypothetical protein PGRAT_21460 [Paenibacillus graminis]
MHRSGARDEIKGRNTFDFPARGPLGGKPSGKRHLNFSKIKKLRGLGGKRALNSALFLYLGRIRVN